MNERERWTVAMLATAPSPELRQSDPVAYADRVTSMCDLRAAISTAAGVPTEHISRNGYRQAQHPDQQRKHR